MAKLNRKKNTADQQIVPPRVLLVVSLIIGLGLGYLGIRARCEQLGADIKKLEGQCEINQRRVENEESKWAALMTPRSIEEALTRHGLNLSWPKRGQVVRIYDSRASDLALVDTRDAVRFAELERVALNE
jgi:hypothetical protein